MQIKNDCKQILKFQNSNEEHKLKFIFFYLNLFSIFWRLRVYVVSMKTKMQHFRIKSGLPCTVFKVSLRMSVERINEMWANTIGTFIVGLLPSNYDINLKDTVITYTFTVLTHIIVRSNSLTLYRLDCLSMYMYIFWCFVCPLVLLPL